MPDTIPILIDLNKPLAARKVGPNELIQRDALKTIAQIVKRQLKRPQSPDSVNDDIFVDRRHNAITIAGGRGTGKTTFMLSLKGLLEEESEFKEQLAWLRPIDPTLIESREHIFVNVLAEMWLHVEREVNRKRPDYKEWNERYLSPLAEGLQVLESSAAGAPRDADWQSPQHSMDLGISRANSSAKLERRFHEFIDKTLSLLNKTAFVVTLDDIDTQFERGWTVMEVVRKYLTSPKLIVLVLGDMHLYSLLVRRQMWSMMAGTVPVERLGEQELGQAVHRLESQYLEKIFKVENRVKLQTLDEVVATTDHTVKVICREPTNEPDYNLHALIEVLCRDGLALKDTRDVANVSHLLLRQPVRTVLHLLTGPMHKWVGPLRLVEDHDVRDILDLLAETSLGALYQHGVRVDDLRSATADNVMDLAIDFLRTADLWHDGYRLKPEFRDDSKNLALLALGSRITRFLKTSPHLLGDYVIRVGITREAGMMKDTSRYIQFVGLETTKSLPTIARRAIGYLRADLKGRADRYGPALGSIATITHMTTKQMKEYVGQLSTSLEGRSHYSVYLAGLGARATLPAQVNTVGSVQRRLRGFGSTLAALPALRLTDAAGRSTSYLSIFPLIAIVSELLDPNVGNKYDDLRRWGQLRSFPLYCEPQEYGQLNRHPRRMEEPDQDEGSTIKQERAAEKLPSMTSDAPPLMSYIEAWATWAHQEWAGGSWDALPSHVLGDIWARFYHAIERADETQTTEWYAGNLLHRYIVAFLNAVLVEEHLARNHRGDIRLQSVAQSDYSFVVNLNHYFCSRREQSVSAQYPWFDLFFRCPLWAVYLRPPRTDWARAMENGGAWSAQVGCWCSLPGEPETTAGDAVLEGRAKALNVEFIVDLNDSTPSVSFQNLYCIYDSVPVQGVTKSAA